MSATATASRPRIRNPQGKGGHLRDELIAAAERVLACPDDTGGFSLRAVAREARVAAPSIYLHFASKNELVRAVEDAHLVALRGRIETAIASAADPLGRLRAGCLAFCYFAINRPGSYRILFARTQMVVDDPAGELGPDVDIISILADAVADCMKNGVAPPRDPYRVATNLWAALRGIVTMRLSAPTVEWLPLSEHVEDMLVGLVCNQHLERTGQ